MVLKSEITLFQGVMIMYIKTVKKAFWLYLISSAFASQIFATIIITEILQNPNAVTDTSGEWFEVYNQGTQEVDMNGWTIMDNGADSHVINSSVIIQAGGYAVFGINDDSGVNGGVTLDYTYAGIGLSNSDDELILLDGSLVEIDRVEWDNGLTFPDPYGKSMTLGDVAADNNIGSNWCEATSTFGAGDFGTPGAINDSCGSSSSVSNPAILMYLLN